MKIWCQFLWQYRVNKRNYNRFRGLVKSVLGYFWDEVKSPALTSRVWCLSDGRQGSSLVQKIASSAWFFLQFVAPGCCIALSSNLPTAQISWPGLSLQCSVSEATTVLLWAHKKEGALPVCCTEHAWSQKTSPVQRSPTGCVCLFVYDLETSTMRLKRPTLGCCGTESKLTFWRLTTALVVVPHR